MELVRRTGWQPHVTLRDGASCADRGNMCDTAEALDRTNWVDLASDARSRATIRVVVTAAGVDTARAPAVRSGIGSVWRHTLLALTTVTPYIHIKMITPLEQLCAIGRQESARSEDKKIAVSCAPSDP